MAVHVPAAAAMSKLAVVPIDLDPLSLKYSLLKKLYP